MNHLCSRNKCLGAFVALSCIVCPFHGVRGANLLTENFDELTLGPIVTIPTEVRNRQAWTPTPPAGWTVDNSGMPANVIADPNIGVKEYQGWTFVDRDWWVQSSGDQDR